jgi:hypothetical protein
VRFAQRITRSRKALTIFAVVAIVAGAFAIPALAVHTDGVVELDGNILDGAAAGKDWDSIFGDGDATQCPGEIANDQSLPAGTVDTAFVCDFTPGATGDSSYFVGSTKDDQSIKAGGGSAVWKCQTVPNATDKDEITNGYLLANRIPSGQHDAGDLVIYGGGERFDNSGDAFMGVWFFQKEVGCDNTTGSSTDFTGGKTSGDILLLVDFTSGGAVSDLKSFSWFRCDQGPSPLPASKCTNPATNAGYFVQSNTIGGDCSQTTEGTPGDNLCAEVLPSGQTITPTWPFTEKKEGGPTKTPNAYDVSEFFEFGFNLTNLYGTGTGGSEPCISSFLMETRSSSTVDATLKDFAGGSFNTCGKINVNKYHDLNGNGVDEGDKNADGVPDVGATDDDPGLQNWKIFIDSNADGVLQTEDTNCNGVLNTGEDANSNQKLDGERCLITDANGNGTFDGLQGGTYSVCEVIKNDWVNSDPSGGSTTQNTSLCENVQVVGAGSDAFVNFGNFQKATISGMKFKDKDANGAKDSTDTGLSGWDIRIYKDTSVTGANAGVLDSGDTLVDTQTTSSASATLGQYTSIALAPGTYFVCERIGNQSGWAQTFPGTGASCSAFAGNAAKGYKLTITSGTNQSDKDFGNAPQSKITVTFAPQAKLPDGTTDATSAVKIECKDKAGNVVATTTTANTVTTGNLLTSASTVTCTIQYQDP